MSPRKFYHMTQVIYIVDMDIQPKLGNPRIERSYHTPNSIRIWPEKTFFVGCSWFKFYLGLALGTAFKFYICVAKELKLQVLTY